jgi:hypothetical protein
MRRVLGSVACGSGVAMALGLGSSALATPITYTMVMNGVSGTLGATTITNDTVTMTFTGDTGNVSPWGPPGNPNSYYNDIASGSITVQVGSGTVYTVTDVMSLTAETNPGAGSRIAFSKGTFASSGPLLFTFYAGATYPGGLAVLTTDYTQSAAGLSTVFASNTLATTGGAFSLGNVTNAIGGFTSAAASAVPGAGLAAIGGVGLAGLARRRRG